MYMAYEQEPQSKPKTVFKMFWAILGIIVISALILFFAFFGIGVLIMVIGGSIAGSTPVPEWVQWILLVLWVILTIIVAGLFVILSPFIEAFVAMMDWARGRTPVMVFE